jgi:hypothetical protein
MTQEEKELPKRPDLGGGVTGIGTDEEGMGVLGASKGLARTIQRVM